MEFGVCTNFAASPEDPAGMELIPIIAQAGFDYVELPVCEVASLSGEDFRKLKQLLAGCHIAASAACNLFPDSMALLPIQENGAGTGRYLDCALSRCADLGIRKIVFASISAWSTRGDRQAARDEIVRLVGDVMVPLFQKYHIRLLVEGLRRQVCNVINTIPEAADVVRRVWNPECGLMADLYHMLCNEEPQENLTSCLHLVEHVHIAEQNRVLPVRSATEGMEGLVSCLRRGGYDGSISFEVRAPFTGGDLCSARAVILGLLGRPE